MWCSKSESALRRWLVALMPKCFERNDDFTKFYRGGYQGSLKSWKGNLSLMLAWMFEFHIRLNTWQLQNIEMYLLHWDDLVQIQRILLSWETWDHHYFVDHPKFPGCKFQILLTCDLLTSKCSKERVLFNVAILYMHFWNIFGGWWMSHFLHWYTGFTEIFWTAGKCLHPIWTDARVH